MERRFIQSRELRVSGSDAKPQISGYASVFNSLTTIQTKDGSFREQIKPGAFTRVLKQDVVCLFNHDANFVLGRTTAGTLRLRQDGHGLYYTCDLPDTQIARDLRKSIKRGDINGCSFAFAVGTHGQSWSEQRDKNGTTFLQRDVEDIDELIDVSPVTHPAYDSTEVSARELEQFAAEYRSRVAMMRPVPYVSPEHVRQTLMYGQSFEDRAVIRRRRQNLLNELL